MSPRKPIRSDFCLSCRFEEEAFGTGARRIAGIDEAGRGPLAGPVVAAAVVMPRQLTIFGLNDSKLVSPKKRERIFNEIQVKAMATGVGIITPETIEEINIYEATRLAMARAVAQITPPPDYLLIDGPISLDLEISQRSIVKGDRLCTSVAAASIIAKVTRDRIMIELHEKYPMYGFAAHKGYGTQAHREALKRYGPCPVHRMSFKGVRE
jgi:ribonuclease HII